jgi:tetratricopeptide (TPR) repeat protein
MKNIILLISFTACFFTGKFSYGENMKDLPVSGDIMKTMDFSKFSDNELFLYGKLNLERLRVGETDAVIINVDDFLKLISAGMALEELESRFRKKDMGLDLETEKVIAEIYYFLFREGDLFEKNSRLFALLKETMEKSDTPEEKQFYTKVYDTCMKMKKYGADLFRQHVLKLGNLGTLKMLSILRIHADFLMKAGEYQEAIGKLIQIPEQYSSDSDMLNTGKALLASGKIAEAEKKFKEVLGRASGKFAYRQDLITEIGEFKQQLQRESKISDLKNLLKGKSVKDKEIELANLLFENNEIKEAVEKFEKILAENPDDRTAIESACVFFASVHDMKNWEKAARIAEKLKIETQRYLEQKIATRFVADFHAWIANEPGARKNLEDFSKDFQDALNKYEKTDRKKAELIRFSYRGMIVVYSGSEENEARAEKLEGFLRESAKKIGAVPELYRIAAILFMGLENLEKAEKILAEGFEKTKSPDLNLLHGIILLGAGIRDINEEYLLKGESILDRIKIDLLNREKWNEDLQNKDYPIAVKVTYYRIMIKVMDFFFSKDEKEKDGLRTRIIEEFKNLYDNVFFNPANVEERALIHSLLLNYGYFFLKETGNASGEMAVLLINQARALMPDSWISRFYAAFAAIERKDPEGGIEFLHSSAGENKKSRFQIEIFKWLALIAQILGNTEEMNQHLKNVNDLVKLENIKTDNPLMNFATAGFFEVKVTYSAKTGLQVETHVSLPIYLLHRCRLAGDQKK